MDIACPNCAATYRVPDSLVASGNPLRCAACDHEWVPSLPPEPQMQAEHPPLPTESPTAPLESPPAPVAPVVAPRRPHPTEPPPLQRRGPAQHGAGGMPEPRLQRRRAKLLRLAWAFSLALVGLVGLGLILFRSEIAQAWPPFARVALLVGS